MNPINARPSFSECSLANLAGGGEMGERTRTFDWSLTPVGEIASWPQSLQIALRILLNSRYAMWLGWGPDLTFFYNDAYAKMTLGPKHPWAFGRSAREVWAEIWNDIGPRAEKVIATGEATWDEGLLLFLERHGFPEETYHTFSYSPLPDDRGGIGGMLCVVTEDTERTIGERRLRILRELAASTTQESISAEDACQAAADTLSEYPRDLPFTLIYLLDDNQIASLVGTTGLPSESTAAQPTIALNAASGNQKHWPFHAVLSTGQAQVVEDLEQRFGPLPGRPWPESPKQALVIPMAKPGQEHAAGFVVAGISPRLVFSDAYRGFLELLAGQVTTAVTNARAYEEERRRAEALAAIDRAKTAFFSNVSHEFRTPLTLMLGPVEDLLARSHTDLPPAAAGQLEVVNRNGLRLLRLVNSLLDFSRIEAGRVRAIYRPTDLATLTTDLVSNFRSTCERAGLRLVVDCPPLDEPVYVDREMWEKVVLNLVSNAFKFTLEGEIEVSLRRTGDTVELRVRDTGTGIPAEEMPKLFERFHRIENAQGRTHEGSGIGLALVQELVKLHNGNATAQSVIDAGTTFTITVPMGSAHLPPDQISDGQSFLPARSEVSPFVEEAMLWLPEDDQYETSRESSSRAASHFPAQVYLEQQESSNKPRLLVADDNADMRQYIVRLLANHFHVEAVPDGEAALQAARAGLPDLVLTDVMMPRLNGFGLVQELRADARTRDLPIIMLSARAGEESRVEGMQAGADDYLIKPFSARELLARVSAHLQMAKLRRETTQTLRESEERFRAMVSATSDVVYRMSPDWTEMRLLQEQEFITDASESGKSWLQRYIHPDDQPGVMEAIRSAIHSKSVFQLEHRVVRNDGAYGWMLSRAVPLLDANGEIVEWFGTATDVTARMNAEEKLRDSEERLRVTLASIGDAVITTDIEGHVTFLNGMAESLTGWTSADASGQRLEDVFHIVNEETRERVESPATRALREGIVVGLANHTVLIAKNGNEMPIDDSAAPVRDRAGQVIACVLVFRDVSERRRLEKQAKEKADDAQRLAAIVDSTEDAIISKTLDGIILSWNAAAERIFGYTESEAIGRSITMLFPAGRLDEEDKILARIRAGERLQHFDTLRLRSDGTAIPVSLTVSPVRDERGQIIGASKIARDITERKKLEEQLLQSAAELSEANRKKDEFLATLAHELRNPLAPLRNALHILELSTDEKIGEQARAMMHRQLAQMVRLVDDLMDISRITRGQVELRKERVALSAVINSAVETSRPVVEQMRHNLSVQLPAHPIFVDGDPIRLSQVFMNLLNNAAKYSDPGSRIVLMVETQDGEVVVSVRDNGIGIPCNKLESIFDMFSQVERSRERAQGGLGIGLTLAKRIVGMHGGSVEARSEGLGHGSEFIVRLPNPHDALLPPSEPHDSGVKKSSLRILIVDDNQDSADSLAMMLHILGNEVATAYDGQEGVEAVAAMQPDVVLLDIGLPKMNGYEAARYIREQEWGQKTVLIAVTGWGQEGDRRISHDAGFNHHLVKPVDAQALMNLLADVGRT